VQIRRIVFRHFTIGREHLRGSFRSMLRSLPSFQDLAFLCSATHS
jgi:hypothetical protein